MVDLLQSPLDLQNPDAFPNLPHSINPNSTSPSFAVGHLSPNADEIEDPHRTSSFLKSTISYGIHSPKHSQDSPPQALQQAFLREGQHEDQAPKDGYQTQPKNWASLLRALGPSQAMKLEHHPELQQGNNAILEIDEDLVDNGKWTNCLVGYFLDGRMNFNLLRSTAHKVWDSMGLVSVIPDVSGFTFFEFRDEEAKLSVLEKGPWFFSKRYLVLKNWQRMMSPTKVHPSKIPVWIRIHGLPLELWNQECFSRIASVIGRPIHVDRATAEKSKITHARICVEIDAHNDLPHEIAITVGGETVVVGVQYQVCPPTCSSCKVFGHSVTQCSIPPSNKPVNSLDSSKTTGQSAATYSQIQCNTKSEPRACPSSSSVLNPQATETVQLTSALGSSYVQGVNNATLKKIGTPQSGSQEVYTSSLKAKVSRAPASDGVSSMLHELHSNSFHVLEEVTPPDEVNQVKDLLLDNVVPPDKFPPPEDVKDTNFEDYADYDSPSTPVPIRFDSYSSPTPDRSKKQQKKAKKLARQKASSKIAKGS